MRQGTGRGRASRWGVALGLLLAVAGCGSNSSTTPTPAGLNGRATAKLVPPVACNPACANPVMTIGGITGPPGSLLAFNMNFGSPTTLPFLAPGTYTITGSSFTTSQAVLAPCPDSTFTAADDKTTIVTYTVTNDVCSAAVSGPA